MTMASAKKYEPCTNEMKAILTLINSSKCVESYRIDGNKSSLFAIIMNCDGYYQIHYQTRGGYELWAKYNREINSNSTYKTLSGARRKLRKMGFSA